jgi:hypothetical protein
MSVTLVYYSLSHQLSFTPVFHVHVLSDSGLKEQEEIYQSYGQVPSKLRHMRHGNFLCKQINKSAGIKWKIITLVRDPIIREISMFFQRVNRQFPNGIDTIEVIDILQKRFTSFDESTDYACTWFDREIKNNFNIDVYDFAFDTQKGYQIIREKNRELLVIRLEDLNSCFEPALKEFLEIQKPIKMMVENVATQKPYKKQYVEVVNKMKLPRDVCELIYSSKFAKHFYSDQMLNDLIKKWSEERLFWSYGYKQT